MFRPGSVTETNERCLRSYTVSPQMDLVTDLHRLMKLMIHTTYPDTCCFMIFWVDTCFKTDQFWGHPDSWRQQICQALEAGDWQNANRSPELDEAHSNSSPTPSAFEYNLRTELRPLWCRRPAVCSCQVNTVTARTNWSTKVTMWRFLSRGHPDTQPCPGFHA